LTFVRPSLTLVVCGLAAWGLTSGMAAATLDRDSTQPAIQAANYTTSSAGMSLKWLPYRPQKGTDDTQVMATAHQQPATNDPFSDPFGDSKKKAALEATFPVRQLGEVPTRQVNRDPMPVEILPDFPPTNLSASGEGPSSPTLHAVSQTPRKSQGVKDDETPSRTLDQELAAVHQELRSDCPKPEDLKPISKITNAIKPEDGRLPPECVLRAREFQARSWAPMNYNWKASCLCHKPTYFEDYQLERYGHSWGPYLQPVLSLGHFFVCVPILPYSMGLNPPSECMYSLGYYRPGSCAPYMLDPLPLSVRAGLFEAGAVVGAAAVIP